MPIEWTVEDHVTILTLQGQNELNLVDADIIKSLSDRLVEFDQDPSQRVCIIRGAGDAHFCAGATDQPPTNLTERFWASQGVRSGPRGLASGLFRAQKPVIGAVVGSCLDEGLILLGRLTDIRVAGEKARFGFPWTRAGAGGDSAIRSRLVHQIPYVALAWMVVVGQDLGAREALRVGLVNEVVPDDHVMARARAIADEVAALAPMAVRAEKQAVQSSEGAPMLDAFLYATALGTLNRLGPDVAEGVAAFNEKRKPEFKGLA